MRRVAGEEHPAAPAGLTAPPRPHLPPPLVLALVVAARFGLLLSAALWTGIAVATLALIPVLYAKLERAQADVVAGVIFRRVDRLLWGALGVLGVGLGARVILDRALPPSAILLLAGALAACRLIAALVVGPASAALQTRMRDANAPASDAERAAFERLHRTWLLLLTSEAALAFGTLYALS